MKIKSRLTRISAIALGSIAALLLGMTLVSGGCGLAYMARPMEAWVVDEKTGQPLEGAHVVANWQLNGGFEGGGNRGSIALMETVTDKDGRFSFPGWGPRLALNPESYLGTQDPELYFFKSGYYVGYRTNESSVEFNRRLKLIRRSEYDDKKISLRAYDGPMDQYLERAVEFSLHGLYDVAFYGGGQPMYRQMPEMLLALHDEWLQYANAQARFITRPNGTRRSVMLSKLADLAQSIDNCPPASKCPVADFFEGYQRERRQ